MADHAKEAETVAAAASAIETARACVNAASGSATRRRPGRAAFADATWNLIQQGSLNLARKAAKASQQ